ncbi:hypothetical protein [Candidatus Uabimicrobium amorphum]|uniref:Type IV fimbrial assembly protein PilB n=1 Tax=Uabimicrobium amorphum TaxID=2596890 RepID=A0A5S9F3F8_UABAM|nr:hypothetical protein [Candidatus Uabimicrobium amorphum]BBM83112.1 type IV fimbrial assembly protein PilB [Candidatus Uabimicrobium amorphum]
MSEVVKVILKDKIANKLVALKLKEQNRIGRAILVLKKKYEHLKDLDLALYYKNEELDLNMNVQQFIADYNYTEKKRIEIRQVTPAVEVNTFAAEEVPPAAPQKQQADYIAMMSQGKTSFQQAILELFASCGMISGDTNDILVKAQQLNQPISQVLIEGRYVSEQDYLTTINSKLDIPTINVNHLEVPSEVLGKINKDVAEHCSALPIKEEGGVLFVAVPNPFDVQKLQEIRSLAKQQIETVLAPENSIQQRIQQLYAKKEEKLIIENGRRLSSDELSMDKCDAPTVWQDKDDFFADDEPQKPEGQIWDAPTLVTRSGEDGTPEIMDEQQPFDLHEEAAFGGMDELIQSANQEEGLQAGSSDGFSIDGGNPMGDGFSIDADAGAEMGDGFEIGGGDATDPMSDGFAIDGGDDAAADPMSDGFAIGGDDDAAVDPMNDGFAIGGDDAAADPMSDGFAIGGDDTAANPMDDGFAIGGDSPDSMSDGFSIDGDDTAANPMDDGFAIDGGDSPDSMSDGFSIDGDANSAMEDGFSLDSDDSASAAAPMADADGFDIDSDDGTNAMDENIATDASASDTESGGFDIDQESPLAETGEPQDEETPETSQEDTASDSLIESSESQVSMDDEAEAEDKAEADSPQESSAEAPQGELAIGEEIPLYGGINPEELEQDSKDEIAIKSEANIDTPAEEEQKKTKADDPEMNLTDEEELLEQSIRDEFLESRHEQEADTESSSSLEQDAEESETQQETPEQEEPTQPAEEPAPPQEKKQAQPQPVAQAQPAQPVAQPKKKLTSLRRNIHVKHYNKISLWKTYPINVVFSKKKIKIQSADNVTQVRGRISVSADNPTVKIVPHVPGCIVSSQEVYVDLSGDVKAQIWITPVSVGKIQDAHLQFWHDGKRVCHIDLDFQVVKQTSAKFSMACAFIFPILSLIHTVFGQQIIEKSPKVMGFALQKLDEFAQQTNGVFNLGLIVGLSFLGLAGIFYLLNRHKKGLPVDDNLELTY